jgi:hypothetical protein
MELYTPHRQTGYIYQRLFRRDKRGVSDTGTMSLLCRCSHLGKKASEECLPANDPSLTDSELFDYFSQGQDRVQSQSALHILKQCQNFLP